MVSVLVLGATGFIGRNLVHFLVEHPDVVKIRATDKVLPQTANLYPPHKAAFDSDKVTFKQANLAKEASAKERGYALQEGNSYDYVFNCAGETKLGQTNAVYQEKITDLTVVCAKIAAECGAKFIDISSARCYDAGSKASSETCKIKPWTVIAKFKQLAEKELAAIPKLNYTIVRPATVYGHGDYTGIMPRLVIGAVYKELGETMEMLWTDKVAFNTVHVTDVVRALWHVRECKENAAIFNVVDESNTTFGDINHCVEELFGIKAKFLGSLKSTAATTIGMNSLTEHVNDKHLQPWSDITQREEILNTPLTPYLDKELLYSNNVNITGEKLKNDGFTLEVPKFETATLRQILDAYIEMKIFPKNMLA